jgi:hypothetical protein
MRRILKTLLISSVVLAGTQSCVDTSALDYHPRARSDAGADAGLVQSCSDCVHREPSCDYAQCAAEPRCVQFFDCTVGLGCYALAGLQDRIDCGQPCFVQLGIKDFLDPAISHFLPISGCTIDTGVCTSSCVAP